MHEYLFIGAISFVQLAPGTWLVKIRTFALLISILADMLTGKLI
tara:strand:+ start:378 stop:509 length:132 start_codon:yes stop_codon:yes gene_type:complete